MTVRRRSSASAPMELDFHSVLESLRASLQPRPAGTPLQILEATEAVFVETGLAGFSMRTIASRVGISLASLQYHYPTRADLLRGFFDFKAAAYGEFLQRTLLELSSDPVAALRFTVGFLLEDALDPGTGALYTQLWALASYDAAARSALEKHMQLYVRLLELLVARLDSSLTSSTVTQRAIAIVAMIEGFPTAASGASDAGRERLRLKEALVDSALAIVRAR